MCRRFLAAIIALAFVIAVPAPMSSNAVAPVTRIIEFDPPGSTYTQATSVNGIGQVSGWYQDANTVDHGFLRNSDGTIISFDPADSISTVANGINSTGQITGYYVTTQAYGFIRDASGNFTTFDASVGGSGFGTYPYAINSAGEVAGSAYDQQRILHGFLRDQEGNITTFETPRSNYMQSNSVRENGDVVGTRDGGGPFSGFLRKTTGALTALQAPEAGPRNGQGTLAASINGNGTIAGYYLDSKSLTHGFIRDPSGRFTIVDVPGAGTHPGQGTLVFGINDSGLVTGYVVYDDSSVMSFVRDASGTITLFGAPDAGTGPGQGTFSVSVNHHGSTTGFYNDANNKVHGFVRF